MLSREKMLEQIQAIFKNSLGDHLVENQTVSVRHVSEIIRQDKQYLESIGLYRGMANSTLTVDLESAVKSKVRKTTMKIILWDNENYDLCSESVYWHKKRNTMYIESINSFLASSEILVPYHLLFSQALLSKALKEHLGLMDLAKTR